MLKVRPQWEFRDGEGFKFNFVLKFDMIYEVLLHISIYFKHTWVSVWGYICSSFGFN